MAEHSKTPIPSQPQKTGGSIITGDHAVSGHQRPPSTNSAAAVELPTERLRPCIACARIYAILIINVMMVVTLWVNLVPTLPDVTVISASATVNNMSSCSFIKDLDVGFLVQNKADEGMLFKNMTVRTFRTNVDDDTGDQRLSTDVTQPPFELPGNGGLDTVRIKHKDLQLPIKWESTTVGVSTVRFEIKTRVRYRSTALLKEIAAEASCDNVEIRFAPRTSDNATQTTGNFDAKICYIDTAWNILPYILAIYAAMSFVVIFVAAVRLRAHVP